MTDLKSLNETSALLLKQLTTPNAATVSTGNYVDVRDVAEAHALALEVEAAGGERFITSAGLYDPSEWSKCSFSSVLPAGLIHVTRKLVDRGQVPRNFSSRIGCIRTADHLVRQLQEQKSVRFDVPLGEGDSDRFVL